MSSNIKGILAKFEKVSENLNQMKNPHQSIECLVNYTESEQEQSESKENLATTFE